MGQSDQGCGAQGKLGNFGTETVGSTPEQFAATMKTEIAVVSKVIKDAGIKAE